MQGSLREKEYEKKLFGALNKTHFIVASKNIALGRPAYQSSTGWGGVASRSVDGNHDPSYARESCTHTKVDGSWNPWWTVDLQWRSKVTSVTITNRESDFGSKFNSR